MSPPPSSPTDVYDQLAGVVDLFGAVTRAELERALDELAFRRGEAADADALGDAVADAVAAYYLVTCRPADAEAESDAADGGDVTDAGEDDANGSELLAVGPVAFPTLPPDAEDLPHIMDVPDRTVDRAALGRRVQERLFEDAARAVDAGDDDRVEHLLDVTYDLEAWAPVEVGEVRKRLDAALQE